MRVLPTTFRASLEDPNNPDPPLVFLILEHDDWDEPYRFVWDVKDYVLDGDTYIGFPFEIVLPGDGEESPQGTLAIQNVDRMIGEAVQALTSAPMATIRIYSAAEFDLTVEPRVPLGTPALGYEASYLFLREIAVDAISVQGQLQSWDFIQEPYPSRRATSDLLPALYF